MAASKIQKIKFNARVAWRFISCYPVQKKVFDVFDEASEAARLRTLWILSAMALAGICWAFWGENVALALRDWHSPRAWLGLAALAAISVIVIRQAPLDEEEDDDGENAPKTVELFMLGAQPMLKVLMLIARRFDHSMEKLERLAEQPERWRRRLASGGWALSIIVTGGGLGAAAGLVMLASLIATVLLITAPVVFVAMLASGRPLIGELGLYKDCWMIGIIVVAWMRHAPWRSWAAAAWSAALWSKMAFSPKERGDGGDGQAGARASLFARMCGYARTIERPSLLRIFNWTNQDKAKAVGISFAIVAGALYMVAAKFPAIVGQLGLSFAAEAWASPSSWIKLGLYSAMIGAMLMPSEWMNRQQVHNDESLTSMLADVLLAPAASLVEAAAYLCGGMWGKAADRLRPERGLMSKIASGGLMACAGLVCGIVACLCAGLSLLAMAAFLGGLAAPVLLIIWALGGKMPELAPLAKEYWGLGVMALIWIRHVPWSEWLGSLEKCREALGARARIISSMAMEKMKKAASMRNRRGSGPSRSREAWAQIVAAPGRWMAAMSKSLEERGIFSDIERDFLGDGAQPTAVEKKSRRL